ncbi:uncharacterized protein PRCAT00001146001 [Priceomyces carsonii]|uniref:uncharacterized protein n=1 Tax=Priceomyces carsonii TaxID=28549 RepID=UPI002ED843D4|nr:unnamed protein product [Priceomyces carsonii]
MSNDLYHCQRCNSPINLDSTLLKVSPQQLRLLINRSLPGGDLESDRNHVSDCDPSTFIPQDRLELYSTVSNNNLPIKFTDLIEVADKSDSAILNSNSYVLLPEDENAVKSIPKDSQGLKGTDQIDDPSNSISSRIRTLAVIFEILSTNQDVDHPLCSDCSNMLIDNYRSKFDKSQKEKESYLQFLRKLKDKDAMTNINNDELDLIISKSIEEFHDLSLKEYENLDKLKYLEVKKLELESELHHLGSELRRLNDSDLTAALALKNKLTLKLSEQRDKLDQSRASYNNRMNHLDMLRNINIYSTFFQISFDKDDIYGTINGFRLGYRIPYPEINAALGQIVLLCIFLVRRLKFKLKDYKLIPMGSQSQIINYSISNNHDQRKVRTKSILNLYASNEFSLGKLFNFNKLDVSMIALLDVVSQIENKLISIDQDIEIPYRISSRNDSLGGKSIRITSNAEWTQGCKFLLTKLNWILSYTSAHTSPT